MSRVGPDRGEDANVQDHELEELEAFDRSGDEITDSGRTDELDGRARDGVDADRGIADEERLELGPHAPRDHIGVRGLEPADGGVVERLAIELRPRRLRARSHRARNRGSVASVVRSRDCAASGVLPGIAERARPLRQHAWGIRLGREMMLPAIRDVSQEAGDPQDDEHRPEWIPHSPVTLILELEVGRTTGDERQVEDRRGAHSRSWR